MFKQLCKQHFPITLRISTTYFLAKDLLSPVTFKISGSYINLFTYFIFDQRKNLFMLPYLALAQTRIVQSTQIFVSVMK